MVPSWLEYFSPNRGQSDLVYCIMYCLFFWYTLTPFLAYCYFFCSSSFFFVFSNLHTLLPESPGFRPSEVLPFQIRPTPPLGSTPTASRVVRMVDVCRSAVSHQDPEFPSKALEICCQPGASDAWFSDALRSWGLLFEHRWASTEPDGQLPGVG